MTPSHLTETTVSTETLFEGRLLKVWRDTVQLPDGRPAVREYIRHPGAVMIIPLCQTPTGEWEVVLERQYRHPVGRVMVEFPAGKLDPGEDPVACGQRELKEETGWVASEWAIAGCLHPCIGYSNEVIHVHFARGLRQAGRQLDEGEFLETFTTTPQQLLAWCQDGTVTDGKTLTGALWLSQHLQGQWPLNWQPVV